MSKSLEGLTMNDLAERNAILVTKVGQLEAMLEKAQQQNKLQRDSIAELEKSRHGTEESLIAAVDNIAELEAVKLPGVAAVMWNLSDVAKHRTSVENVRDVLEAIRLAGERQSDYGKKD